MSHQTIAIKEYTTQAEMELVFPVLKHMYPELSKSKYLEKLAKMIPHNYTQVVALKEEQIIGVSGIWIGTKLWCERYLEIDNFIIDPTHRNAKVGSKLLDFIQQKAETLGCNLMVLDTYTDNFKAIKLFMNNDFIPRGFHMIKPLNGFTVEGKV